MGLCAVLSVAVGGVVYLLMRRDGTLPAEGESEPISTGAAIALMFGYVGLKALLYKQPALTAEQHYEQELRDAWTAERSLRDAKPWSQFIAWPQPRAGGVAVLIVCRDPDGSFAAETFDTLPGDSSGETGAELMWEARRWAEQAEVDAIAAYELARTRERQTLSARRDDARRAGHDTQAAVRVARAAADITRADVHDRRIEAEGLAAAMRGTVRQPPR